MTNKLSHILSIAAVLALGATIPSFAAEKEKAAGTAANATAAEGSSRPIPYHGKVSTVDATAKTFSLKGKEKDRVFTVTDTTKITKDGAAADLSAVTAGEEIRGQATKNGDKWEATSILIGEKPTAEKKAKKVEAKAKEPKTN